jgi:hypothetical protein
VGQHAGEAGKEVAMGNVLLIIYVALAIGIILVVVSLVPQLRRHRSDSRELTRAGKSGVAAH